MSAPSRPHRNEHNSVMLCGPNEDIATYETAESMINTVVQIEPFTPYSTTGGNEDNSNISVICSSSRYRIYGDSAISDKEIQYCLDSITIGVLS